MGQWDDIMKMLVGANPQDFVTFLMQGAAYKGPIDRELKVKTTTADLLYNIEVGGDEMILHVEFQRRRDALMGKRLWRYNASTTILYDKPVASFVLYLAKEDEIVESPYQIQLYDGTTIHTFSFVNVKLWELSPELFERPGLEGLLPLIPLTAGGTRRERLDEMIQRIQTSGKEDLLALGYVIAGLVLGDGEEKKWLQRRFAMLQERLEDSWAYKEIVEKGLEKGLREGREKGIKEGREEGQVLALRSVLMSLVQVRFAEMLPVAMARAERIRGHEALQSLVTSLIAAQDIEEARNLLSEGDEQGEEQGEEQG